MELFSLGNLITLAIVALAFVVYHQFAKRGQTISKIREFSKKTMKELDEHIAAQESAVKDYIVNLDIEKKSAGSLYEQLLSKQNDVKTMNSEIGRLSKQLLEHQNSMAALDNQAAGVEENLNRLKEVSAFLDTSAKRLGLAEGKLKSIEKNIDGLEKEFEQENSTALEKATSGLLASVQSDFSDLRAELETMQRLADEHLDAIRSAEKERAQILQEDLAQVESALSKAISESEKKADETGDSIYTHIKEKLDASQTEINQSLDTETANVLAKIKEMNERLEAEAAERNSRLSEGLDARVASLSETEEHIKTEIEAMEKRVVSVTDEINRQAAIATSGLDAKIVSTIEDAEKRVDNASSAMLANIDSLADARKQEIADAINSMKDTALHDMKEVEESVIATANNTRDTVQSEIDTVKNTAISEMNNTMETLTAGASGIKDTVITELNNTKDTLISRMNSEAAFFKQEWANDTEALASKMEHIQEAINSAEEKAVHLNDEINRQTELATSGLDTKVLSIVHAAEEKTEQASIDLLTSIENLASSKKAEVTEELSNILNTAKDEFSHSYAAANNALNQSISTANTELEQKTAATKRRWEDELAVFAEQIQDIQSTIRKETEDMQELVKTVEDKTKQTASEFLVTMEDLASDKKDLISQGMNSLVDSAKDELNQIVTFANSELKDQIAGTKQQWQTDITTIHSKFEEIEVIIRETDNKKQQWNSEISQWAERLNSIKESFSEVESAIQQNGEKAEETEQQIKALNEKLNGEFLEQMHQAQAAIQKSILDDFENFKLNLDAKYNTSISDMTQTLHDAQNQLHIETTDIETRWNSIKQAIEAENGKIIAAENNLKDAITSGHDTAYELQQQGNATAKQGESIKQELAESLDHFRKELKSLELRRSEAQELEEKFIEVKHLGEDINTKMTQFISEKRHLELMEEDFNRLLKTREAVEQKLSTISDADETLNNALLSLRNVRQAMDELDEREARIENRKAMLDTTAEGITANFNHLQEADAALKEQQKNLLALRQHISDLNETQNAINENLAALKTENDAAQATAAQYTHLKDELNDIDNRISNIDKTREFIAQAETRFDNLKRDIDVQIKLLGKVGRVDEQGKAPSQGQNTSSNLSPSDKANIKKLIANNYTPAQVADLYKISIGEIELVLNFG
ncbi:MAG: hypothetical protein LBM77_13930 [Spirochaetaceae bacterium]|nr:hypothetical protein [Spirochaetaceae bacterium]